MNIKLITHIMPWEIDYALLSFSQLKHSSNYIPSDVNIEFDSCLNLSDYIIDWEKSNFPKQYFIDKYNEISNGFKNIKHTPKMIESNILYGHLDFQREVKAEHINYYITTTGAPTATTLSLNLPSGLVIDSSKMPDSSPSTGNTPLNANGVVQDVGGNYFGIANAGWLTGGTSFSFFTSTSSALTTMTSVSNTVPFTWASGDKAWIHIRVPIVGWTSGTVHPAAIGLNAIAAFSATRATAQTGVNPNASRVKINFNSIVDDTLGGFNTSSFRYDMWSRWRHI
jgi:hypothetical protein